MPISFMYASAENESRLACWFFQPKRPPRTWLLDSATGTWMNCPRMPAGWLFVIATRVLLSMDSTKPSPRVLSDVRKVRTLFPPRTRSWNAGSMARSLISDPPGWSTKLNPLKLPARSSVIWLMAPVVGFWWHSAQDCALYTGPSPPAFSSRSSNSARSTSNWAWSTKPLVTSTLSLPKAGGASTGAWPMAFGSISPPNTSVHTDIFTRLIPCAPQGWREGPLQERGSDRHGTQGARRSVEGYRHPRFPGWSHGRVASVDPTASGPKVHPRTT